jgi:tetratricopeptide (TPR) repeat protein
MGSLEWDTVGAEREFKRAISLNPNYAPAHQIYGFSVLGPQGRLDEAILEMKEAERLDPLSSIISTNLGDLLLMAGRLKEAKDQYEKVLETGPDFAYAHSRLGLTLLKESRYEEAISEIKKSIDLSNRFGHGSPDLIYAYRLAGRTDDVERLLAELDVMSKREYVSNVDLAMAYGAAGRNEKAIEFLEKAAAEKSNQLRINLVEPHFDQLRSDPRFQNLLKAVGIVKAQ